MALEIRAHWDAEARVWWAESDDVVGLVAEAATVESLLDDLRHIVPELMALNAQQPGVRAEIRLVADRVEGLDAAA